MNLIKNYPILYSKKNNKIRFWQIQIFKKYENIFIVKSYGLLNGKVTKTKPKKIDDSKKKNSLELAKTEANSLWKKKKESGFYENINQKKIDMNKIIRPMKAHKLNNHITKISYPCYVQKKLDGFRCLANNNEDNINLYSKNMKKFIFLNHIKNELKKIKELKEGIYLDGELYNKKFSLSEISGLVMRKKDEGLNIEKMNKIKYYIFDMFNLKNMNLKFEERYNLLEDIFKKHKFKNLELVKIKKVDSLKKIEKLNNEYLLDGYEGVVVRNKDGLYKLNSKSYDVLRTKEFKKSYFKIIDAKSGTGSQKDAIIWVVRFPDSNKTFSVIPLGSINERINIYKKFKKDKSKYIGKKALIKYLDFDKNKLIIRNPILIKLI